MDPTKTTSLEEGPPGPISPPLFLDAFVAVEKMKQRVVVTKEEVEKWEQRARQTKKRELSGEGRK